MGLDFFGCNTFSKLSEHQAFRCDIDDTFLCNDVVNALHGGQRVGAFLDDLGRTVLGHQLHGNDDLPGAVAKIHGAAHTEGASRACPVGQIPVFCDLKGAEYGGCHAAASDDSE